MSIPLSEDLREEEVIRNKNIKSEDLPNEAASCKVYASN